MSDSGFQDCFHSNAWKLNGGPKQSWSTIFEGFRLGKVVNESCVFTDGQDSAKQTIIREAGPKAKLGNSVKNLSSSFIDLLKINYWNIGLFQKIDQTSNMIHPATFSRLRKINALSRT